MNEKLVTDKQGVCLIVLFIIGSSSIVVPGLDAKKDVWLAIIISILISMPLVIISSRLHVIFPEKDLFDIIETCFGKFIGKLIVFLYTFFVFHSAAEVLRNFSQFVIVSNLSKTPLIVPMICISILIAFMVNKGINVMGRWSETFIVIPVGLILVRSLFLIPDMNINNLLPVLYNGMGPVLKGAFTSWSFPFGQTILFTMFFSKFKSKKSPYKIYTLGLLLGGILILITSLTNILVLGVSTVSISYFPSFATSERINVLTVDQRLEIVSALIFIIGQYIKISILVLCSCKGVSKIANCSDYRFIVTPTSILMVNICYYLHTSVMAFYEWVAQVFPYYALPFQMFFPIIIWVTAEVRNKYFSKP
ncbi:GerAB/ArcD/ProY family transporter [Clostridium grantii]|uniref:Spore germination protein KB n=1 Tax=Clostridium grantii DSM 8605 TaxID=1121316 RepID=A0A1M5VYC7_9CLOT|nr:endospore germination permease [Clostridium grantii]SHH80319.1 spore germination protein KB [Clostridium grantii DSM 8605]